MLSGAPKGSHHEQRLPTEVQLGAIRDNEGITAAEEPEEVRVDVKLNDNRASCACCNHDRIA